MDSKTNSLMKCINQISFFDGFTNVEKKKLIEKVGIFKKYDKQGVIILKDGDIGDSMFVVLEGVIDITRGSLKGNKEKPVVLAKLKKGSVFGEISLLSNQRRTTGAITKSPLVILMEIDKRTLKSFDSGIQNLFQSEMIIILIRRLNDMNKKYIEVIS